MCVHVGAAVVCVCLCVTRPLSTSWGFVDPEPVNHDVGGGVALGYLVTAAKARFPLASLGVNMNINDSSSPPA